MHRTPMVTRELRATLILAAVALLPFTSVADNVGQDPTNPQEGESVQAWALVPKITWTTTRDDLTINPFLAGEIYMMNTDLTDVECIMFTENASDFFPVLSPTGKRMVFDSNRLRGGGPINTSDLFLMNPDGTEQTHLVRGSSATSPIPPAPSCSRTSKAPKRVPATRDIGVLCDFLRRDYRREWFRGFGCRVDLSRSTRIHIPEEILRIA